MPALEESVAYELVAGKVSVKQRLERARRGRMPNALLPANLVETSACTRMMVNRASGKCKVHGQSVLVRPFGFSKTVGL